MKLRVTHETRYDYEPVVETAHHMAYVRSRHGVHQQLLSHSLHIGPTPAQIRHALDVFGNSRCFFSLQAPHASLGVLAESVVTTVSYPLPVSTITWEQARAYFEYHCGSRYDSACECPLAP